MVTLETKDKKVYSQRRVMTTTLCVCVSFRAVKWIVFFINALHKRTEELLSARKQIILIVDVGGNSSRKTEINK